MDAAMEIHNMPYRYAQHRAGQKLHLARIIYNHGFTVALLARCGKRVDRWRLTINLPMGCACKNCLRTLPRAE